MRILLLVDGWLGLVLVRIPGQGVLLGMSTRGAAQLDGELLCLDYAKLLPPPSVATRAGAHGRVNASTWCVRGG